MITHYFIMNKIPVTIGALLICGLLFARFSHWAGGPETAPVQHKTQSQSGELNNEKATQLQPIKTLTGSRTGPGVEIETGSELEQVAISSEELDRSDWGIDEWNLERLSRYETMFLEEPTRGASRFLLTQSIAIILDARGRSITREQGVQGPTSTNNGVNFGFTFNNWKIEFGPGEFPEYELALPFWGQSDRKLREGEELLELEEDLRLRILDRAVEARLLLEAKLR
jgi:hypothetical protein